MADLTEGIAPINGMNLDVHPLVQPEGTTRIVWDAVISENLGALTTEKGLEPISIFLAEEMQIGECYVGKGDVVLFTCPTLKAASLGATIRRIILLTKEGKAKTILHDVNLGFEPNHKVRARYKVNSRNGHRIVYFVDGLNPDRFIDIDELPNPYSIDKLALHSSNLKVPSIERVEINDTGGSLVSGVYEIVFGYEDVTGVTTNFVAVTGIIPITESVQSVGYNKYQGCEAGTTTSKSIYVSLNNLDTNYKYLVCAVRKTVGGVMTAGIFHKTVITGSSLTISMTGTETVESVEIASLIVPTQQYKSSKYIERFNDELWLANLKSEDDIDFQEYANQIKVNCIHKSFAAYSLTESYKNGENTERGKTFMEDEVVPLAIRLIYKSGNRSQPFHIPARELQTANYLSSTINSDEDEMLDASNSLNYDKTKSRKRWEVLNTGQNGVKGSYQSSTVLTETAYWESTELYPETGGFPEGVIRHHRVSDDILPVVKGIDGSSYCYKSGFKLSDIKIPKPVRDKIQGFEILRGVRDFNSSSVVLEGYAYPVYRIGGSFKWYTHGSLFTALTNIDVTANGTDPDLKLLAIYSPDAHFLSTQVVVGQYIKYKGLYSNASVKFGTNQFAVKNIGGNNNTIFQSRITGVSYIPNNTKVAIPKVQGTYHTFENTNGQGFLLISIEDELPVTGDFLESGNGLAKTVDGWYISIKKEIPNQYGKLEDIRYVNAGYTVMNLTESDFDNNDYYKPTKGLHSSCDCYSGDSFVGNFTFRRTYNALNIDGSTDADVQAIVESFCKSRVNPDLRHKGIETWQIFAPDATYQELFARPLYEDNIKFYNRDYSRENDLFISIPDADDRKYVTEFPQRIIASQRDLGESYNDNNRIFLANDYVDVPQERSEVTGIFVRSNRVFVHTAYGLFDLNANFQELKTDIGSVYVGTGKKFSLPPKELLTTVEGTAGSITPECTIITPSGVYFIDYLNKQVLVFTDSLSPLEIGTMSNFFKDNTRFNFFKEFNQLIKLSPSIQPLDETNDMVCNPVGVGWSGVFDKDNKRLIMSKRDFTFTDGFKALFSPIEFDSIPELVVANGPIANKIQYSSSKRWFYFTDSEDNSFLLNYLDTDFFVDKSYTISYSLLKNSFTALHHYKFTNAILTPNEILLRNNKNTFYNNTLIYKGFHGAYNSYMDGVNGKFTVEVVFKDNPKYEKLFSWLQVMIECKTKDSLGEEVDDKNTFFNKLWVYNDYQGSNEITLTLDDNVAYEEGEWRINEFYDKLNDTVTRLFEIDGVDKKFAVSSFPAREWFEEGRFLSRYLIVRLIFDNTENKKLSIFGLTMNYKISAN